MQGKAGNLASLKKPLIKNQLSVQNSHAMSDKGTVFQKGGGGTNFEQYIQAAFVVTMAVRGNVPGLPTGEIEEIAFQATNRGWQTDDLYIKTRSTYGCHQVLLQAKHALVFSEENLVFKEVMEAFWKDFTNPSFNKTADRLLIVKNRLNNTEKNHIKGLLNYAKTHATASDFVSEVNRIKEKKERLHIFRAVLATVIGSAVSDESLWTFLKCVDVLGYDFLNEASVDETYLLNLIKLSKSAFASATETEIWHSILAFVSRYNPAGGSVTQETIKEKEFYRYFDPKLVEPVYRSVEKLLKDSSLVLRPIKNEIGPVSNPLHLLRNSLTDGLANALNDAELLVVTGAAGTGKSAAVKDVLQIHFGQAGAFAFRAEQFNEPHLANVFAAMEVPHSVEEVFSAFALIESKIVFIDALEKLLEDADPENAFSQFVSVAKENGIKVIATCRRYAVDLVVQKFGLDKNNIAVSTVPSLTDDEIQQVVHRFRSIQQALQNTRIRGLLRVPKYLDFIIRSLGTSPNDFASSSILQFKSRLWNTLVCKSEFRNRGLPAKREKAFMEITLSRAKELKLYARPQTADEEAVDLLEADEMIVQDGLNRRYAPAHDILEDWALERYVSEQYEHHSKVEAFFTSLGKEPAIRRGFRLWVEDTVAEDTQKVTGLIRAVWQKQSLENYWSDELLVAVFQSEHSNGFFTAFEEDLLLDNGRLLQRCLELIKTTCKRMDYEAGEKPLLLPIGSGWKEALLFISWHVACLNAIRPTVLSFLDDWEYRLVFQYPKGSEELVAARDVVSFYIDQLEAQDEFWLAYSMERNQQLLVTILYSLAPISVDRIVALIKNATKTDQERGKWQLHSFYEKTVSRLLGGVRTDAVVAMLPDLVVDTAWKVWKYVRPKPRKSDRDRISAMLGDYLADDHCWGIEGRYHAFPSGIYKTFVYNLIVFHPEKGLQFITEFLNYSVAFYVKSKCRYKHEVGEVQITLNDCTVIRQFAGYELWVAYRGLSVTDYLLECLLMSLEKFLFELAEVRSEGSRQRLRQYYNYLLKNSNSVMITGVLASLAVAHPKEVGEEMLPLVSLKDIYDWEAKRSMQEHSALAVYDGHIPYAQKARWEWNQLPHRKKYNTGFADFLVDYQFTIKTLNEQLHAIFDKMAAETPPDDVLWKKKLTEIDVRKWVVSNVVEEQHAFIVQPEYEPEVKAFMDTGKEKWDLANRAAGYSQKLSRVYEQKEEMEFALWEEYYTYYSTLEEMDFMHDRPATFSVIGLRDFSAQLTEEQLRWCVGTLAKTVGSIVGQANLLYPTGRPTYNFMEREIALEAFHLLYKVISDKNELLELRFLMLFTTVARFADHELEKFVKYIREVFAQEQPSEVKKLWECLIGFSQYKKKNSYFYDDPDTERLNAAKAKEFKYLERLAKKRVTKKVDIASITFGNSQAHLLFISLCIMPAQEKDVHYHEFLFRFLHLLIEDMRVDEDEPQTRRGRQMGYRSTHEIEKYIAEYLLYCDEQVANKMLAMLAEKVYKIKANDIHRNAQVIRFVNGTLDMLVYRADDFVVEKPGGAAAVTNRFWILWHHLFAMVAESRKANFIDVLLLDTQYPWGDERDHVCFLNGRKEDYHKAVQHLGNNHLLSVLKVLSTIGRKEFLPDGLFWVTEIVRQNPAQEQHLNSASSERFVKTLYLKHIAQIKTDQKRVNEFIWLLDKMVELGNTTAFLYREDVISYRKPE